MNNPTELTLDAPTEIIPRIGPKTAKDFAKLGIHTAHDLLFHFPFRHEDYSKIVRAADLRIGEQASTKVQVLMVENRKTARRGRLITEAIFQDKSGSIKAIWFNGKYIPRLLQPGQWVYLSGTLEKSYYGLHMVNPIFENVIPNQETVHAGRLVPVYRVTGNLTPRIVRTAIAQIIHLAKDEPDWLPDEIKIKRGFSNLTQALRDIHFPKNNEALFRAVKRLSYNELFTAGLIAEQARAILDATLAPKIPFQEEKTKEFVAGLPFKLTNDQKKTAWQILQDLQKPRPMNRLLEGEVGSGKTVVAAIAALNNALAGYQTVYLAPTEILAAQHAATLKKLLNNFNCRIALLTQSRYEINGEKFSRKEVEDAIQIGDVQLIIGTHALLQSSTKFYKTGLLIVDEQHRFGVEQRKKLRSKDSPDGVPHLLSMTATPIPRTLALTAYGDLDCSVLKELPGGRKPIKTTRLPREKRLQAYEYVRQEIKKGRQAFVICPLIDESDSLGVKAATKIYKELTEELLPDLKIGLLHGKLKSDKKEEIMEKFNKHEIDVLVATAVVEVGIDVPNATAMVIEGADRFGLAQLHQFRGRIGRGEHASECFILSETETQETLERLDVFVNNHDGFALAEHDLARRGPGQIFGQEQSGFADFRIANINDHDLVSRARHDAHEILKNDKQLDNYPLLKKYFSRFNFETHLE